MRETWLNYDTILGTTIYQETKKKRDKIFKIKTKNIITRGVCRISERSEI